MATGRSGTVPGPLIRGIDLAWTRLWHQFCPRRPQEALKLVWVFLEPAGQIMVLLMIFALIGRTGGYGVSFALFLLTGVAALTVVQRGMQAVSAAVVALRAPQRPAALGPFIDPLAALGFTWLTGVVYTLGLAAVIGAWQHVDWVPVAPATVLAALVLAALFGFGLGLIRGWGERFAPIVTRSLNLAARSLIFISGVFYMPAYLPPFLRDWLAWNPVLQAVELLRRGFYGPDYPALLDLRYLVLAVLSTLALGVALVWSERVRLMED
ncbi:MAG: hypothetical protein AAFR52_02120 [Pseudomonadota bacterium]